MRRQGSRKCNDARSLNIQWRSKLRLNVAALQIAAGWKNHLVLTFLFKDLNLVLKNCRHILPTAIQHNGSPKYLVIVVQ